MICGLIDLWIGGTPATCGRGAGMATASGIVLIVAAVVLVLGWSPATCGPTAADWPAFQPAPARHDFRGPGDYLSWIKILAAWLRVSGLGGNHRLAQHRLPGVEAGLLAMEPDRLRHVLGGVCAALADPFLLDRLSAVGDRLRRAAGHVHHPSERQGGQ